VPSPRFQKDLIALKTYVTVVAVVLCEQRDFELTIGKIMLVVEIPAKIAVKQAGGD